MADSDFNCDFHVAIDTSVAPVEHNYRDQSQLEAGIEFPLGSRRSATG